MKELNEKLDKKFHVTRYIFAWMIVVTWSLLVVHGYILSHRRRDILCTFPFEKSTLWRKQNQFTYGLTCSSNSRNHATLDIAIGEMLSMLSRKQRYRWTRSFHITQECHRFAEVTFAYEDCFSDEEVNINFTSRFISKFPFTLIDRSTAIAD